MPSSPPSPPPSFPHSTHVEHRITRLEVTSEDHANRISVVEKVLWALIIGLSGMIHEKLPRVLDTILSLKP